MNPKTQVAGTNDFSIQSKFSLITKGYVQDPFLRHFVDQSRPARSPIINRGYYVRHCAIEYGFKQALADSDAANIVISLGAGFDTSALRHSNEFFIELDYPTVCQRKAAILIENSLLGHDTENLKHYPAAEYGLILKSRRYLLIGADLRKSKNLIKFLFSIQSHLQELITTFSNDKRKLNFILFNECSLCYIEQHLADQLIHDLIQVFTQIFHQDQDQAAANLQFVYLGYEMLDSLSCCNDFGHFLLDHFASLGASILTFITEDDIRARFGPQGLNFEKLNILNMKPFWRESIPQEEIEERIERLEPFDEWEELDNVCASYALTMAWKRRMDPKDVKSLSPFISAIPRSESPSSIHPIQSYSSDALSLFGHCSVLDRDDCCIRVFGGFGHELSQSFVLPNRNPKIAAGHRRLANVVELHLDGSRRISRVQVIRPGLDRINRVHAQVVNLGGRYLLSGGRTSPSTIQSNVIVDLNGGDSDSDSYQLVSEPGLNRLQDSPNDQELPAAYRHVCCRFGSASDQLIQLGGVTTRPEVPNGTVFLFDIATCSWTKHHIPGLETGRHSIGFTPLGADCLLLSGGLDSHRPARFATQSAGRFDLIDRRDTRQVNHWTLADGNGQHHFSAPLYSHRLVALSEWELLSIGGIGQDAIRNVVRRIDLRSRAVTQEYSLQVTRPDLLLMHGLTCELINVTDRRTTTTICMIGGSGNCFSFGTHFNPILMYEF